jgi:hypothetical protein
MDAEVIPSSFEKWVAKIESELYEYSKDELEQLLKKLCTMSMYGTLDNLIDKVKSEIQYR